MASMCLNIVIICVLVTVCRGQNLSSSRTTPLLVQQDGYPIEVHTAQTSDGYILTMHRIPYSPKLNNSATQRSVAFLFHGLSFASTCFVANGPERSLAFILSDAGYDVWLGNARGNVYSKKHVSLSPLTSAFWDFSWHEIGIYDIPAMVDYALNVTGEDQVRYFGYSQGTTTFMLLNTMIPSFKSRIRSAHLLAPVAFMENSQSLVFTAPAPELGLPTTANELLGHQEYLPSSRALELLAAQACKDGAVTQEICVTISNTIFGQDSPFLNKTQLPEIFAIFPAGSSLKQYIHAFQLVNSGQFRQYDYGPIQNVIKYGRLLPPDYNFANIDVPIYLYYSDNDSIATVADVERLIAILERAGTLSGVFRVPKSGFNHGDFLFGIDVKNNLYSAVMNDVANS